jgi:hypothetical protein
VTLGAGGYTGSILRLASVAGISIGDSIVQDQTVSLYTFNQLLHKLDIDTGVHDTNYYSLLNASNGADMRAKLVALATKLDADTGVNDTDYASVIGTKTGTITAMTAANPTVITCVGHGLVTGRNITISGSNCTPSANGNFIVTVLTANTFTIDLNVTSVGTSGTFATNDASFNDLLGCYNKIITKLNGDTTVGFSNYAQITITTSEEAIVTAINTVTRAVTVNTALPFIVGPMTVYTAIESTLTYSPNVMGDALGIKHLRESTMMFANKAFTSAKLAFATDLLPEFIEIPFNGDGNGIFGSNTFGNGFFGGASNSAPFRTFIPRQCQRCRFIRVKFTHKIAREQYAIFGVTITGEVGQSTRGYR